MGAGVGYKGNAPPPQAQKQPWKKLSIGKRSGVTQAPFLDALTLPPRNSVDASTEKLSRCRFRMVFFSHRLRESDVKLANGNSNNGAANKEKVMPGGLPPRFFTVGFAFWFPPEFGARPIALDGHAVVEWLLRTAAQASIRRRRLKKHNVRSNGRLMVVFSWRAVKL